MKLNLLDFEYLGVNVYDYPRTEIEHLKANLKVIELLNELINGSTTASDGSIVVWEIFKYKIYQDIYYGLKEIYCELFLNNSFKLEEVKEAFRIILEGMVKLREKDINTISKIVDVFRCSPKGEGTEIPDEDLSQYNHPSNIPGILKHRNIKRLKQLFEEREIERII